MSQEPFGYSRMLPENIRGVFMWLCQDLTALQSKWDLFVELYGKEENTSLLSDVARASFNMIYDAILNDMVVGISRLTDPSKSGPDPQRNNLTLSALLDGCEANARASELRRQLKALIQLCKPIRLVRNRRVGHRDLQTALSPLDNPLPGISKHLLDEVLKAAGDLLNDVASAYDVGALYDFHTVAMGTGESLVFVLREGQAALRDQLARSQARGS